MIRTSSQVQAEAAFEKVKKRSDDDGFDEYVSAARDFPTLIHTSGLLQTLAFADAKKGARTKVADDVAAVLGSDTKTLTTQAKKDPAHAYIHLTERVLTAAGWIKRYAEGLKKVRPPATTMSHAQATPGSPQ